jgi:chromosome segregation ATPase
MTKVQVSNNKRILQEQVSRLTNEIEELRLEREASKKNVLHFMQEADTTRQELKKAQELIEELAHNKQSEGYNSPPPESNEETPSVLFSKLSLLSKDKLAKLFDLVENNKLGMVEQLSTELHETRLKNVSLKEELDQLKQEYQATQHAFQVENERADIIEHRWKESESHLEQAESTIQSLSSELDNFKQKQQEWQSTNQPNLTKQELCRLEEQLQRTAKDYEHCKLKLDETKRSSEHWQEKYDELSVQHVMQNPHPISTCTRAFMLIFFLKT